MEHSKLVGLKGLGCGGDCTSPDAKGCGKMIVGSRLAMLDLWQSRAKLSEC